MKNHTLAGAVSDASFAEFHQQLTYKAAWRGGIVVKADRFFCIKQDVFGLWREESHAELVRTGVYV